MEAITRSCHLYKLLILKIEKQKDNLVTLPTRQKSHFIHLTRAILYLKNFVDFLNKTQEWLAELAMPSYFFFSLLKQQNSFMHLSYVTKIDFIIFYGKKTNN